MNYLDVLRKLKETRSRNVKIDILRQADEYTRAILVAAYDPFTHYFINKVPAYKPGDNITHQVMAPNIVQLLKDLASRAISGNKARDEVQFYMNHRHKYYQHGYTRTLIRLRMHVS